MANNNANNIKLGICNVNFNGVDLGHTKGTVEYIYKPKYQAITADLYGDTPLDEKLVGEEITVKVPMLEKTIVNLKTAIPNATFAGAGNSRITIGQQAGQSLKASAAQLVLHPVAEGTRQFDIVLYKAVIDAEVTIKHENNGETIISVTFKAYIDETKAQGNYLGLIGDSTT